MEISFFIRIRSNRPGDCGTVESHFGTWGLTLGAGAGERNAMQTIGAPSLAHMDGPLLNAKMTIICQHNSLMVLLLDCILGAVLTPMTAASTAKTFTSILEPLQTGMGWVVARVPFDIAKAWPVRKGNRVRGEIAGLAFRSSLMAYAGGGGHFLLVNAKMQKAAKASVGAKVRIRLEPDLEERLAVIPLELAKALKGDRRLRRFFDELGDARRKDIGGWVMQPISEASRQKRAEQVAEWLLLTLEGELDPTDPPPILKAAFQRHPLARAGWEKMSPARRRNHLLGIFHLQGAEARERRAAMAVEDALLLARKSSGAED
jgi:uncharacterized protein YdeI (YjbR/CyaY-like superfamily)